MMGWEMVTQICRMLGILETGSKMSKKFLGFLNPECVQSAHHLPDAHKSPSNRLTDHFHNLISWHF